MLRSLLLLLAGTAVGIAGTALYTHYLGEGPALVQTQGELAASRQAVATVEKTGKELRARVETQEQQITRLISEKKALATRLEQAPPPSAPAATPQSSAMSSMVTATMAGMGEKKLLALKARLHLTPDQEARIKAALDAQGAQTRAMTERLLRGEKLDPSKMASEFKDVKPFEKQLEEILTPEQKTEYAAMKQDEKQGRAETAATVEMNQVAPVLGLTEEQKDGFYGAIYQVTQDMQDPGWIKKLETPGTPASQDPTHYLELRMQAKREAVSKVLTPAQMEIYGKQLQSEFDMQKAMMQKIMPAAAGTP